MEIRQYLDDLGIEYSEVGEKNVTDNHVEIKCPFCEEDPSKHLGINLDSGVFHCWICEEPGNLTKLIQKLEGISWRESKEKAAIISSNYNVDGSFRERADKVIKKMSKGFEKKSGKIMYEKISLPKGSKPTWDSKLQLVKRYMNERKLSIEMQKKYNLYYCISGYYRNRLIIPINNSIGDLIGFTARDMIGKENVKYLNNKGFQKMNHLYGLNVFSGGIIYLVEGCLDAIRMEEGGVALMGKEMSDMQELILFNLYRKKWFEELVVILDSDAYNMGLKIGKRLRIGIDKVKIIRLLGTGDPAELGRKQVDILVEKANFI